MDDESPSPWRSEIAAAPLQAPSLLRRIALASSQRNPSQDSNSVSRSTNMDQLEGAAVLIRGLARVQTNSIRIPSIRSCISAGTIVH